MTYYNQAVVSEKQAFKYIIDSNLDWNQTATLFWENRTDNAPVDPDVLQPGMNIYSANKLAGVWWDFSKHAWVRRALLPTKVTALNYYVYNLDDSAFKRYLNDQRILRETEMSLRMCENLNLEHISLEASETNTFSGSKLCLVAKEPIYLRIKKISLDSSPFDIGEIQLDGSCNFKRLDNGLEAWFKVEKGVHYICSTNNNFEYSAFSLAHTF